MDATLTRRAVIANARREIRALPQPKGIRWDAWIRVQHVLVTLAGHLPNVWPSLDTLADELGWHKTSVHRAVCRAESLGLVSRNIRSRDKHQWDSTEYLLTCLSTVSKADAVRVRPEHTSVHSSGHTSELKEDLSLSERDASPLPSGGVHGSDVVLADQARKEAEVARHEVESEPDAYGAPPDPPPAKKVRPVDPAWALAVYFDEAWGRRANHSRQWRGSRASDRRKSVSYIKGVMLGQVSPEMVTAYMDSFITAVLAGEVELKEGQLPFERFTGWWGHEAVADPVETARLNAIKAQQYARLEEHRRRLAEVDDAAE